MIPAVVIGGERRIVDEDVTPRLRRHGLDVIDVFPMDKEMGDLPQNAAVFVFLTNMMSHRHNDAAKAEADRRGDVKVVYGSSKGSLLAKRLTEAGYPAVIETNAPPAPVKAQRPRVSNPTLPGGYYSGELYTSTVEDDHILISILLYVGPKLPTNGNWVYTDVLINRTDYERDDAEAMERVRAFVASIGIRSTDDLFKPSTGDLMGRMLYFHYNPNAKIPVSYLTETQWKLKSAAQRRRTPSAPPPTNPVPHLELVPEPPMPTLVPAPAPAPAPASVPEPSYPLANYTLLRFQYSGVALEQYDGIFPILAAQPTLTGGQVLDAYTAKVGHPVTRNGRFNEVYRDVRKALGITSNAGGTVTVDRVAYEAVCAHIGVTPQEGTTFHRPANAARRASAAAPPPPVVVSPTAPSFITAGQKGELDDLREIVAMLRDEMARRDIRRLVVTPDDVAFTRVVTVEGKLEF
jgi:hypothetical protein